MVSADHTAAASMSGTVTGDGPIATDDPASATAIARPAATSTIVIGRLRSASAAASTRTPSGTAASAGSAAPANAARRIRDESPRDLQEQEPDGELDAPDQRPRECPRCQLQRAGARQHEEDEAHQHRAGGDHVDPEAFAIAIAPNAFSGCTGIGSP